MLIFMISMYRKVGDHSSLNLLAVLTFHYMTVSINMYGSFTLYKCQGCLSILVYLHSIYEMKLQCYHNNVILPVHVICHYCICDEITMLSQLHVITRTCHIFDINYNDILPFNLHYHFRAILHRYTGLCV